MDSKTQNKMVAESNRGVILIKTIGVRVLLHDVRV